MSGTWAHETFDDLLETIVKGHRIAKPRLADVLIRLLVAASSERPRPSQSEIASGEMLLMRWPIAQDAVSRATTALAAVELVQQLEAVADRPGRPYTPLELGGAGWAMVGVKILSGAGGRAERAHILVTGLDGRAIPLSGNRQSVLTELTEEVALADEVDIADAIGARIEQICEVEALRERLILGVGVDVPGHVFDGVVIDGTLAGQPDPIPLGKQLSRRLSKLGQRLVDAELLTAPRPFPVMVDNDLHVLGVLETYQPRFAEFDWMVAAVFTTGIGSAQIIGGRVYRGDRGMAGEIGHMLVSQTYLDDNFGQSRPDDRSTGRPRGGDDPKLPGFSDPCYCRAGTYYHLDCYTPARMLGELGETFTDWRFAELANADAIVDGYPTRESRVFARAGAALGMALANAINFFDPSRILLYLPPVLAAPEDGSNAERYWREVVARVDKHAFSDSRPDNVQLTPKALPANERVYLGAKAAAVRVMDSLIQHARGRCKCVNPQRRDSSPTDTPEPPVEDLISLR